MLITMMVLTVVEVIITMAIVLNIIGYIYDIKNLSLKLKLHKLINNRLVIVLMNLGISYLLTSFTGSNLTSGFANLSSSVLVGVFGGIIIDKKYSFDKFHKEAEAISKEKLEKKKDKKNKKVKESQDETI